MKLSSPTILLCRERLDQVSDVEHLGDEVAFAEYAGVRAELAAVVADPTTERLGKCREACREIGDILTRDEYRTAAGALNTNGRTITADLCRAGYCERFDPDTVSTRRPKTMVVDGVRYVVG